MHSTLSVAYRERIFSKFRTFFWSMFQDFASTLEGAEVEVYYYWFTLLLSNILLRFLVFLEIFQGDDVLSSRRSKSSRGRNKSITTLVARKQYNKRETISSSPSSRTNKENKYIYIKKNPQKSKTTPS